MANRRIGVQIPAGTTGFPVLQSADAERVTYPTQPRTDEYRASFPEGAVHLHLLQCFQTIFPWRNLWNNFSHAGKHPPTKTFTDQKIRRLLIEHGDYSSITNYQIKISTKCRGIFGICRGISKSVCLYTAISRGGLDRNHVLLRTLTHWTTPPLPSNTGQTQLKTVRRCSQVNVLQKMNHLRNFERSHCTSQRVPSARFR